ncbi:hypothetical protein GPECTOR_898g149 [Gonium pectorale]|uniref:Uncharacterized protein n=1 Tax=Gonium pectorale TaxID=33097 RepID=A0A150FTV7_GONPE|nr:hypothetical protein GPECTOR_898g149 [Gonium pectorale]|eukprot:KXZ41053.1 hypothetical protein GPECTOR_898g149 [Gonium pectorale]
MPLFTTAVGAATDVVPYDVGGIGAGATTASAARASATVAAGANAAAASAAVAAGAGDGAAAAGFPATVDAGAAAPMPPLPPAPPPWSPLFKTRGLPPGGSYIGRVAPVVDMVTVGEVVDGDVHAGEMCYSLGHLSLGVLEVPVPPGVEGQLEEAVYAPWHGEGKLRPIAPSPFGPKAVVSAYDWLVFKNGACFNTLL